MLVVAREEGGPPPPHVPRVPQGEEIFLKYGSEKPFEHFRKEAVKADLARKAQNSKREVIRLTWVPYAQDAEGVAAKAR